MDERNIHFIGVGNMGLPMAINLGKEFDVKVFDVDEVQLGRARDAGLPVLDADAIGQGADVVITMLPAGEDTRRAVIESGLAERMNADGLIIDCSTTDHETAVAIARYAEHHQLSAIDAPVSGGIKGAQDATLTIMVGGSHQALERARPLLDAMGQNVFHAGANGAGQVAKTCNNMLLAISMAGTCEALNLGHELGLDVNLLSQIMHKASGSNWVLDHCNPWPEVMEGAPAGNGYQGGFKSKLMLKDLVLAENAARAAGQPIYLGSLARNLYANHCAGGAADHDFSSLLNHYREDS